MITELASTTMTNSGLKGSLTLLLLILSITTVSAKRIGPQDVQKLSTDVNGCLALPEGVYFFRCLWGGKNGFGPSNPEDILGDTPLVFDPIYTPGDLVVPTPYLDKFIPRYVAWDVRKTKGSGNLNAYSVINRHTGLALSGLKGSLWQHPLKSKGIWKNDDWCFSGPRKGTYIDIRQTRTGLSISNNSVPRPGSPMFLNEPYTNTARKQWQAVRVGEALPWPTAAPTQIPTPAPSPASPPAQAPSSAKNRSCLRRGKSCDAGVCCSGLACQSTQSFGKRCRPALCQPRGRSCRADESCCDDLTCQSTIKFGKLCRPPATDASPMNRAATYDTLLFLLGPKCAGIISILRDVTIMGPSDEAFSTYLTETGLSINYLCGEEIDMLAVILTYHVFAGALPAAAIKQLRPDTLDYQTLYGEDITIDSVQFTVNGIQISNPDAVTSPYILHGIDRVLVPPNIPIRRPDPAECASRASSCGNGETCCTGLTCQSTKFGKRCRP